jgi:transketolase
MIFMDKNSPRKLSLEAIKIAKKRLLKMHFEAGVGHIGGNLSALDALLVIFHDVMREQDAFILSKGHAAGALYTALWSIGKLQEEQLKTFHQDDTLLPAHPPALGIPEILFATGSLGHGFSLAAGMALGAKLQNHDRRILCMTSDGEWQEGSTWEALVFSSHHQLDNLTVLIDHNELQGFGSPKEVASMSPLWDKISGYNVQISIVDGHDVVAIQQALELQYKCTHLIFLKTIKGHGVDFMEGKMQWHYLPMSQDQYQAAIQQIESV